MSRTSGMMVHACGAKQMPRTLRWSGKTPAARPICAPGTVHADFSPTGI
jgi:hypothetical protein